MFGMNKRKPLLPAMGDQQAMQGSMTGPQGQYADAQPSQGGLFGSKKRSILPYILAAAQDTTLRQLGEQPTGVANLNAQNAFRQQQAAALADEQRKQSMQMANWQSQYDYKNSHPAPPTPGSFEWYMTASPQEKAIYEQYKPLITNTAYGTTVVPRSSLGQPEAPQPGTVQDGYRFNGGDPADPSNWVKM